MTTSYWQKSVKPTITETPIINLSKKYDVCIIGAGIAGLSTAYWLQKNDPHLKIIIIDKFFLGAGASGRNAGFLTCGSAEHFQKLVSTLGITKALEIWKFSELNHQLLMTEIIQDEPDSVDYKKTGSCTVAAAPSDWERYQNLSQTMTDSGIKVELINEKYLAKNYGVHGFSGAIQYMNDALIHPVKLLHKIKSKLQRTDFISNTEVFKIEPQTTSVIIHTNQINIECSQVFSCLNSLTSDLFPDFKKLILPQRGQILLTEQLPQFVQGPCYLTKHLCYFRQLPSGELLIGGFRNLALEAENTAVDETTAAIQDALTDFTKSYFKIPADIKINHRWSGIMGFTPDGQMLLGEHPTLKNVFIMGGCSGHGMGLSFNAARVLVESTFGKSVPMHLSLNRFKK